MYLMDEAKLKLQVTLWMRPVQVGMGLENIAKEVEVIGTAAGTVMGLSWAIRAGDISVKYK